MIYKFLFVFLIFNGIFYFGLSQNKIIVPFTKEVKAFNGMYIYYDGSNNKYTLLKNVLEYYPIKAAESSSGSYDGGKAFKKTLDAVQQKKLLNLFKKLLTDKNGHTTKNIKPNCSIKLEDEEGNKTIIIKAANKTNKEVLLFLKNINK